MLRRSATMKCPLRESTMDTNTFTKGIYTAKAHTQQATGSSRVT